MKRTALLVFVTLQRVIELGIASRNTRTLRRRGAYEVGGAHYPAMVALHASWLGMLWLNRRRGRVAPPLVVVLVLLQLARAWVLATLGGRWTTRIIILPHAAPIVSGPYRFVRHPNYLIVALELPSVALGLGLLRHAVIFGCANLAMLAYRISCEDRAFAAERHTSRDTRAPNLAAVEAFYDRLMPALGLADKRYAESATMTPVGPRVAFRVASRSELAAWETRLREFGARNIERSDDMAAYPAIFFEDPAGTQLELCAGSMLPS